jgi:SAM-dependent methyltransferase
MMMAVLLACEVLTADVSLYAPTPVKAVEVMLELAEVTESDIVYDLGCGDGRVLIAASQRYGCRSVGIDIDPDCVAKASRNVNANNLWDLARVYEGDVLTADFSRATVVTLYLMPDLLKKLKSRLDKQLAPGTRIVCFEKPIPGVKPSRQVKVLGHTLYLYRTPLVCVECTGST